MARVLTTDCSILRISPFLVLMALVFGAIFADEASASCGDYLHLGKSKNVASPQESFSHSDMSTPLSQATFPRPCNGPNCRRQMPTPPLPQPIPVTVRPDQSAVRFHSCELATSNLVQQLDPLDGIAVDGYPSRVQRPPRV